MGRKRKDGNPLGLEPRVYPHHGQFWYVHRNGDWEALGTDVGKANERARLYNDTKGEYGSFGYFIDLYIAEATAGRLLEKKSPRTIEDYGKQRDYLKPALGKHYPHELVENPSLISDY